MIILGIDVAYKGGAVIIDKAGLIHNMKWNVPKKAGVTDQERRNKVWEKLNNFLIESEGLILSNICHVCLSEVYVRMLPGKATVQDIKSGKKPKPIANFSTALILDKITQHIHTMLDQNWEFSSIVPMRDSKARSVCGVGKSKKDAQIQFGWLKKDSKGLSEDEIDAYVFAEALRRELKFE